MSFSKSYFKNEAIWILICSLGPAVAGLLVFLVVMLMR